VLVAKEQRVLIKRDNQRSAVFDDYSYITYRDPAFPRKASDPNLIFETRLRRCEPFRKDLRINKGDTFQFADPDFKYGLEYVRRCSGLLCPKFPIEIRVSRTPIGG